jgi:hypothetical protein
MKSLTKTVARPATDFAGWQSVRPLDLDALARARAETINLAQWLARIANSYVLAGPLDARLYLEYRPGAATFVTKPFDKNLNLALHVPTLKMQFHEHKKAVPHIFDPQGRSPAATEAWLLVELLHHGVDRAKFSKKLPYNIPGLMTGDATDHSPQSCQQALTQLTAWFRKAAAILDATAWSSGAEQTCIVCWPQTLNLSCASNRGSTCPDAGFSPGDPENQEPYFYRGRPTSNGSWVGKGRSILTASELLAASDPAAAAFAFLTTAAPRRS